MMSTWTETPGWLRQPESLPYGDAAGVTVLDGTVIVFARAELPMQVLDDDGAVSEAWGRDLFVSPHGITASGGLLLCVDDKDHVVRALDAGGAEHWRLGEPGVASDTGFDGSVPPDQRSITQAAGPFHRPTHATRDESGRVFVTDGYGNSRIHRFDAAGAHEHSWGAPGSRLGEFFVPHSVEHVADGRLLVCDRENDRIQLFDVDGAQLGAWLDVARPSDVAQLDDGLVAVAEMGWRAGESDFAGRVRTTAVAPSISVRQQDGSVVHRITGSDVGPLRAPHGIAAAPDGTLYVAELLGSVLGRADASLSGETLRRFTRV